MNLFSFSSKTPNASLFDSVVSASGAVKSDIEFLQLFTKPLEISANLIFRGRENDQNRLKASILISPIIFLFGPSGSGKNALVCKIAQEMGEVLFLKINTESIKTKLDESQSSGGIVRNVFQAFASELRVSESDTVETVLTRIFNSAFKVYTDRKIVLVIDEFDQFYQDLLSALNTFLSTLGDHGIEDKISILALSTREDEIMVSAKSQNFERGLGRRLSIISLSDLTIQETIEVIRANYSRESSITDLAPRIVHFAQLKAEKKASENKDHPDAVCRYPDSALRAAKIFFALRKKHPDFRLESLATRFSIQKTLQDPLALFNERHQMLFQKFETSERHEGSVSFSDEPLYSFSVYYTALMLGSRFQNIFLFDLALLEKERDLIKQLEWHTSALKESPSSIILLYSSKKVIKQQARREVETQNPFAALRPLNQHFRDFCMLEQDPPPISINPNHGDLEEKFKRALRGCDLPFIHIIEDEENSTQSLQEPSLEKLSRLLINYFSLDESFKRAILDHLLIFYLAPICLRPFDVFFKALLNLEEITIEALTLSSESYLGQQEYTKLQSQLSRYSPLLVSRINAPLFSARDQAILNGFLASNERLFNMILEKTDPYVLSWVQTSINHLTEKDVFYFETKDFLALPTKARNFLLQNLATTLAEGILIMKYDEDILNQLPSSIKKIICLQAYQESPLQQGLSLLGHALPIDELLIATGFVEGHILQMDEENLRSCYTHAAMSFGLSRENSEKIADFYGKNFNMLSGRALRNYLNALKAKEGAIEHTLHDLHPKVPDLEIKMTLSKEKQPFYLRFFYLCNQFLKKTLIKIKNSLKTSFFISKLINIKF